MPTRDEFIKQMNRDLSSDDADSPAPFSGSFNTPTPIKKTKNTKKNEYENKKRGKNHFDLYIAFEQVAGSTNTLVIG